jgi:peptide/nickel transport system substrate-binding protein
MKRTLATLFLALVLLLSACGKGATQPPATAAPAATTAPAAKMGGTVVLILPEEPTTLNYYASDAAIVRQVADATSMTGLTMVNEKGDFYPVLATGLPTQANGGLSADNLTVTWKLLPDLKWSDGQPLTSDDVKFTLEVLSNPNSGALSGTGGFDLIQSV